MKPSLHSHLVNTLARSRHIQTTRFIRLLRDRFPSVDEQWRDCREQFPSVVPDAFFIDPGSELVAVFEVEITSPLTPEKLDKYVELFWLLDEDYCGLDLWTIDRYGTASRLDILACVYEPRTEEGGPTPIASEHRFSVFEEGFDGFCARCKENAERRCQENGPPDTERSVPHALLHDMAERMPSFFS